MIRNISNEYILVILINVILLTTQITITNLLCLFLLSIVLLKIYAKLNQSSQNDQITLEKLKLEPIYLEPLEDLLLLKLFIKQENYRNIAIILIHLLLLWVIVQYVSLQVGALFIIDAFILIQYFQARKEFTFKAALRVKKSQSLLFYVSPQQSDNLQNRFESKSN